jgi:hypothetical protein
MVLESNGDGVRSGANTYTPNTPDGHGVRVTVMVLESSSHGVRE